MKIAVEDVLTLLHTAAHGTLATHSTVLAGYPYGTAVGYMADDAHCPVICVSALAEHTRNLRADPRVSLSVTQPGADDVQAAARLTLVGDAEPFIADETFIERYARHAPDVRQWLALDFTFIRIRPRRVRFIAGLGRMGWVESDDWLALPRLSVADETRLLQRANAVVPSDVCLLGIDRYGIDAVVHGRRGRWPLPGAPVTDAAIDACVLARVRTLGSSVE